MILAVETASLNTRRINLGVLAMVTVKATVCWDVMRPIYQIVLRHIPEGKNSEKGRCSHVANNEGQDSK